MKNEYIIISKTAIQKRIEELEKEIKFLTAKDAYGDIGKLSVYKQILSQSTPLIPEIEKAYNAGKIHNNLSVAGFDNPQGRYISNLKLDI